MTFSTVFPSFHPRRGEKTAFVEKIIKAFPKTENLHPAIFGDKNRYDCNLLDSVTPKWHTIREGKRWKAGDWFSARIWSKKPYRSKQIEFAKIQVLRVFRFEIDCYGEMWIDYYLYQQPYDYIASNDGLSNQDFIDWLIKPAIYLPKRKKKGRPKKIKFRGQIICWNDQIEYT